LVQSNNESSDFQVWHKPRQQLTYHSLNS